MSIENDLSKKLMDNILSDMKVELTEEFDKNFEQKGFFGNRWAPRKRDGKGTLLVVTGGMRRSVKAEIKGQAVVYTSLYPYTALHNEGGTFSQSIRAYTRTNKSTGKSCRVKAHSRKMNMPKRQFIGDHQQVRQTVRNIIEDNMKEYCNDLNKLLMP